MKTMKKLFVGLVAAALSGFAISASACAGNGCVENDEAAFTPQSVAAVQFGGKTINWGTAAAQANNEGQVTKAQTYTFSDGFTEANAALKLKVDANCPAGCGDQVNEFSLFGSQKVAAGAQGTAESDNGTASSLSRTLATGGFSGHIWGGAAVQP